MGRMARNRELVNEELGRNNNGEEKNIYVATPKEFIKETKMTVISLAYTDSLSVSDLMELSEILETIAGYKSSTNKKKGL